MENVEIVGSEEMWAWVQQHALRFKGKEEYQAWSHRNSQRIYVLMTASLELFLEQTGYTPPHVDERYWSQGEDYYPYIDIPTDEDRNESAKLFFKREAPIDIPALLNPGDLLQGE